MRISYEWLKSMADVPEDPSDLVAEFVRTGTEVEAVEKVGADLTNVVTAQVVSKKPHPDSDPLAGSARSPSATATSTPTATPFRCRSSAARRTSRRATTSSRP